MTENQQAAFIQAQSTCALIEAMGMVAENTQSKCQGDHPAYIADDFNRLITKYGIHHNDVLTIFT